MAKKLHLIIKNDFSRFVKYVAAGVIFFCIDLAIFWYFTKNLKMEYILATIVAFTIANSLNYFVNRNWGFRDTAVKIGKSYASYMLVGATALILITLLMLFAVQVLAAPYFASRATIGILVGLWNYIINHLHIFEIPFVERIKV
jgi:putative flippase GtrA